MQYGNGFKLFRSAGQMGRTHRKKIKTDMNCSRNVEEEVKKSVSKADVLGYFTSLINKKKKTAKNFEMYQKGKTQVLTILICSSNMQFYVALACSGL